MARRANRAEGDIGRVRIVSAARRLFASRGFDGASLQEIGALAGVSKASVLHHFPSKEAVRAAVLEDMLSHWKDALPRVLVAATTGKNRFEAVVGELMAFFFEDPDRARMVVRESLDRPEETAELLAGSARPLLEAISGLIRDGRSAGAHCADVDPEAYVLLILQGITMAAASARVADGALGSEGSERLRGELVRVARNALFPAKGPEPRRSVE